MGYYTEAELQQFGFKKIGKNVKISKKTSIYNPERMEIGDHCRIDDFCVISGRVVLTKYNYIGPMTLINGGEVGVFIEDYTGVSYGVRIFSQSDSYTAPRMGSPLIPDEFKAEIKAPVYIRRHCGIGASSVILPGVEIAEGCGVGAMTLVRKSTQPWTVVFGVPARKISERSREEVLDTEAKFLASINET